MYRVAESRVVTADYVGLVRHEVVHVSSEISAFPGSEAVG